MSIAIVCFVGYIALGIVWEILKAIFSSPLMECHACDKQISKKACFCPTCGHPYPENQETFILDSDIVEVRRA